MCKSYNGPRSNISFLPIETRQYIYKKILDGYTCVQIGSDPIVSDAFLKIGKKFNRSNLSRIKKSKEFKEFEEQLKSVLINFHVKLLMQD